MEREESPEPEGQEAVTTVPAAAWLVPEFEVLLDEDSREPIMHRLAFTALGSPKPKGRPRTVRNKHTGFVQTYTPDATVNWEQAIGWQVKQALAWVDVNHPGALDLPWEGRLMVNMRFNLRRPKSIPKRVEYPLAGADVDNLAKSVLDALQNVNVIGDDKTCTDISSCKRYADEDHPEGVEVEVLAWV